MNKTERQLAITLELQRSRMVRAEDLAAQFETSVRTIYREGNWVLVARCDLRQDIRHFRLSRMTELAVLEERFAMPPGFNLSRYSPPDDRHIRVLIRVSPEIADKVAETCHFYWEETEVMEDGRHLVTFRVRRPEELLPHILGWGGDVEVLEPESFRSRIREEALKIVNRY